MVDKFYLLEADIENALHDFDLNKARSKISELYGLCFSENYKETDIDVFKKRVNELIDELVKIDKKI